MASRPRVPTASRMMNVAPSIVVALSAVISAGAQSRPPGTPFRAGVDLVALTVTVTDSRNEFVKGLTRDDFAVYENGVEQPITYFGVADIPLDLALVVDTSASMHQKIALVRRSAGGLVRVLRQGDRAALITFQQRVSVHQEMTANLVAVGDALQGITVQGSTALFDALYVTLDALRKQTPAPRPEADVRRRAIVVLSDGDDTASYTTPDQVHELARVSGVAVYVVALHSASQAQKYSPRDYSLRKLAEETGGQAFFPTALAEIESIYDGIGAELSSQYALGYVPREPAGNGEWRRLNVRVTGGRGVTPRTRAGYYAGSGGRRAATQG